MAHSEPGSKGLTFVNPYNKGQFMRIGQNHLSSWAKAILAGKPGVDNTHPPNTPEFEWLQTRTTVDSAAPVQDPPPTPHPISVPSSTPAQSALPSTVDVSHRNNINIPDIIQVATNLINH